MAKSKQITLDHAFIKFSHLKCAVLVFAEACRGKCHIWEGDA